MRIYKRLISMLPNRLKNFFKPLYYSSVFDSSRLIIHPLIMRNRFNRKFLECNENFLRVHLGCGNIYFPGYINIDFRKTQATDYVCDASELPFPNASIEIIETYHMIEHLPKNLFLEALQNWWDKLIPGGKIVIECPDFDIIGEEYLEGNEKRLSNIFGLQRSKGDIHRWGYNFLRLKKMLQTNGYKGIKRCSPQDYHRLEEPCMRVEAYKSIDHKISKSPDQMWLEREKGRPETLTIEWRENHIHAKILRELEKELFEGKKTVSLGCGTGELETVLGKEGYPIVGVDISSEALRIAKNHKSVQKIKNILFVRASIYDLPFPDDSFDAGYAIEIIEHIEPSRLKAVFSEIKRVLKPDSKFLITTPNKYAYYDPAHRQFFTKASLAALFDKLDLSFDWLELEERRDEYRKHDMLKVMFTNKPVSIFKQERRICAIGGYEHYGYTELGFHWDGQARAFKESGYETLLLDIRKDTNYENLRAKILACRPDLLWLGLMDCLPFIKQMEQDIVKLREGGCKVIYWFCDQREPRPSDFRNLADFMFLSNAGQIEKYRRAYNIERVYYMPQACTPTFMHRLDLEEIYDIGFAGSLTGSLHKRRKRILKAVSRKYDVIIKNNVRNDIANFCSKCRIILGINPDFDTYLYTSNRFFVALGCGSFYLCEWFPGIDRLVKNHEHLVWFRTEKELLDLIAYYLESKEQREEIRRRAQTLAHSTHTYAARIGNMIDIINGKTNGFYGFLDQDRP